MEPEAAVRAILIADTDITALVVERVNPAKLPQSPTLPAIVLTKISGPRLHDLSGPSGKAYPRIQADCWAETYAGVKTLATLVRQCLDGYSGAGSGLYIGDISIDGETDIYEPGVEDYRVVQDYIVWHDET